MPVQARNAISRNDASRPPRRRLLPLDNDKPTNFGVAVHRSQALLTVAIVPGIAKVPIVVSTLSPVRITGGRGIIGRSGKM